jgi:hypothetical protein
MAYKQTPGRGPMATFKNVSTLLGPTAEVCTPDGGGGADCPKPYSTTKKTKFKDSSTKSLKRKGTIETKKYTKFEKDPGMEVSVNQITPKGETGRIESKGKNLSDFKKEVTEAGKEVDILNTGIAGRAAKFVDRPKEKQVLEQTIQTRRDNKGKAKFQVEKTGTRSYDTRVRPEDMTIKKDRIIGKDKIRKYTTNESRAQNNKGRTPDVKLVSVDKMRKLSQKATKKLTKGNPMPVKPKESKSSKKKSMYM